MIIARTAIYPHTRPENLSTTPLTEQEISLVVSEISGIWYTAAIGYEDERAMLTAKGAALIGKPIDPNSIFPDDEATYRLGTNPWQDDVLFKKETFPKAE